MTNDGLVYRQAGPIIEDIASLQDNPSSDFNPLYQFRQDQLYTPPVLDDKFVMFDGYKIYTGYLWPFCKEPIDLADKDWLLDMWDETQAPGVGALLFVKFKQHKLMDCIPQYLSNPAFMADLGAELRSVMRSTISGKVRNDILFRYQRLLQLFPIMFETLDWLDDYWKDYFGTKLFRFGIANAFGFIKPENVTAEMIHEAIGAAQANADKRLVPPTDHQYIQMYEELLKHDGAHLVNAAEIVRVGMMSWKLARRFIKSNELDFNAALSIAMTFIYRKGNALSPYESHDLIETLYNEYGPSDQWPTFHNVVQYVNAVTSGRVQKSVAPSPQHPTSITATKSGTFD